MKRKTGPGNNYYKWPLLQGETVDTVRTRCQSGVGLAFIDAYVEEPESTVYRDHAKDVASFLKLHEVGWEVMQKGYETGFDSTVYWYVRFPEREAAVVIYHYNGGVPAIANFFLQMYNKVGEPGADTGYYKYARRATQYMKVVADTGYTTVGETPVLWAKWWETSDVEKYASYVCWGTPGIVGFLDSMYVAATQAQDSAAQGDRRFARAGLQWLMDSVKVDTTVSGDTVYWWYRYPDLADDEIDTTYSPMWGQGVAGISGTFLMVGFDDLAADSADSATYYRFAKRSARWVESMADPDNDVPGYRWVYRLGHTTGDTLYYTYFCRGQGPVIRYFAEMYDHAKAYGDGDSLLYLTCADSGRVYLDSTKVPAYEGTNVWIWDGCDVLPQDNPNTLISVSLENGPPGLGLVMLLTAKAIGDAQNADSAKFTELAFHCANWLKAEFHDDLILGGYKWPWRAAEDSITVKLVNQSTCSDPCTLFVGDTLKCDLWIYNWSSENKTAFWWVDILRWNNTFKFFGDPPDPDSGTVQISAQDSVVKNIEHVADKAPKEEPKPISVNGSAGWWVVEDQQAKPSQWTRTASAYGSMTPRS
jgi:hypothetical protein